MKTLASVIALTLGLTGIACAGNNYFPPERIDCRLSGGEQLNCDGFNRKYLLEDTYNADFPKGRDDTFHFYSAVAYFNSDQSEASVFYTYHNTSGKMVKLKTFNTSIRPDLTFNTWKKFKNDIYRCTAGYMQCPITNLPV
jgi:hypothetical protein